FTGTILKNLAPGASAAGHMLAFTPKPYRLDTTLRAEGKDKFFAGDVARTATRYLLKMELRGVTGVVASILGKDPPQVRYWISTGAAPGFVKFEGPMFLNGPRWRVEGIGPRRGVVGRGHPVHRREAADVVEVGDVQAPESEVFEVRPVAGALVARQVALARGGRVRVRHAPRIAHERQPAGGERITRPVRLHDEQARARVRLQILRVHRHTADEEDRPARIVERVRHDRRERVARMPARERRQRPGAAEVRERARALREGGLGNGRRVVGARRPGVAHRFSLSPLCARLPSAV